jgi:hypothetical protein
MEALSKTAGSLLGHGLSGSGRVRVPAIRPPHGRAPPAQAALGKRGWASRISWPGLAARASSLHRVPVPDSCLVSRLSSPNGARGHVIAWCLAVSGRRERTMDKEARFHSLIADLHGAALDASLWQPALRSAVELFDVRAAHFFLWDVAERNVPFSVCQSPAACEPQIEAARASYTSHYANLDYRRELTDRARPGTWMHCHEWTTPRALGRNEFFNDFLRPANLRWLSGMRVSQASGPWPTWASAEGSTRNRWRGRIAACWTSSHLISRPRVETSSPRPRCAQQLGRAWRASMHGRRPC